MATFVVIFLGLVAIVLITTPLIWQLSNETRHLNQCVREAQNDVAEVLRRAEYYRLACEHAPDGINIQDMSGRIVWANPAYLKIHGRTFDEIIGRNPLEFVMSPENTPSPDEIANFRFDPNGPAETGLQLYENQHSDGTLFWNQIGVSLVQGRDGNKMAVLVCRNVSEQVEQANELADITRQLEHEATHDSLTGIANRTAFLTYFEETVARAKHDAVGLLHIDLDDFKSINDTHGHSAGDAILVHAATTIRDLIGGDDMVARIGGDEFVVFCPHAPDLQYLRDLSASVIDAFASPFEWSNRILHCQTSIGAARSNSDILTADDLLSDADYALYEAKRNGRGCAVVYDETLQRTHIAEITRSNELAEAVDIGKLTYHFQPTVNLDTGDVSSIETLVRWDHPEDGLLNPDAFLPMVRELGLMGTLDLWSMTAALVQKRRLNDDGFEHIGVAFNASPELLAHPEFINRLIWGVEAGELDREQITIEIREVTELGSTAEASSQAAIIHDLTTAGFRVQLDDFGVGFAGLSNLAKLDINGVKIDAGLASNFSSDDTNEKIVRKIVELCNDLDLTVVAEGVEDMQTAQKLRAMGCKTAQGYWLADPMAADDLHEWLGMRHAHPAPLHA